MLKILLIEHNRRDVELAKAILPPPEYSLEVVSNGPDFEAALNRERWGMIVADYYLPGFTGDQALDIVLARRLDVPFVVLSGTINDEVAIRMLRRGASDYVFKNNLNRLPLTV